jgi:hypothetical protein
MWFGRSLNLLARTEPLEHVRSWLAALGRRLRCPKLGVLRFEGEDHGDAGEVESGLE